VICIDCYVQRSHHIFCSPSCWFRLLAAERIERFRQASATTVPFPLFVAATLTVVVVFGLLITSATRELDAPVLRHLFPGASRSVPLTAKITALEEKETTMDVVGTTVPNALVFLLHDGKVIGNATADSRGGFRFTLGLEAAGGSYAAAAAMPSALATTFIASRSPLPERAVRSNQTHFVESFTRGATTQPSVVLSFDAGSNDRGAMAILDTLRQYQIRTTIFLTGEFIERYPEVARAVVADGHEVGNHTWSHPHLTSFARDRRQATLPTMTRQRLQSELQRTADEFRRVTGKEMARLWRAPFGEENSEIRGWAAELGYLHVGWTRGPKYNLDSLDWVSDRRSPIYFSSEKLAERLLNFDVANRTTLNGSIVLMHLGSDRSEDDQLSKALPQVIRRFEERGFRFVTVSELKEKERAG
jgi:peptidoglycan/xylan/chitin deacetylase (PgdA/CDA1 family)